MSELMRSSPATLVVTAVSPRVYHLDPLRRPGSAVLLLLCSCAKGDSCKTCTDGSTDEASLATSGVGA
jgi:hypothetical protein